MNRLHAFLIVLALWAAIYLPGLGSTELKGEEGRRILPGVAMLETHQWLVPYVGGKPFLRKPPLINWLIAASFKATGVQNEWSARLPSVLAMLALALVIVGLSGGQGWMSVETALVAAAISLTQLSSVEKGRLAEIDAVYSALTGVAMVLWLAWWFRGRSPWLTWLVPAIFLGLAALAKGPLHLLYFYGIAAAVLWRTGEWRRQHALPSLAGLLVIGAIWEAWYYPYSHRAASIGTAEVWRGQFLGRLTGSFDFKGWLLEIPRGLVDRLPWVLFAPLLWRPELPQLGERPAAMFRGIRLAVVMLFIGLLLLPGMLPRYTMPLFAPFSLLLGWALADERMPSPSAALRAWWRTNTGVAALLLAAAFASPIGLAIAQRRYAFSAQAYTQKNFDELLLLPLLAAGVAMVIALAVLLRRRLLARPALLALSSSALVAGGVILFAGAGAPFLGATLPAMGASIDAAVPPRATLYVFDADFLPTVFYLHVPYRYAPDLADLPSDARWVLARADSCDKVMRARPDFVVVSTLPEGQRPELALLKSRL